MKTRDKKIKINDFLRKTTISGMGGVQRRVGEYSRIINDKKVESTGDSK